MSLADALAEKLDLLRERHLEPVDVAVLDTGIDATHPDLTGRVTGAVEIALEGGRHRVVEVGADADNDPYGHGTGVGSVIASIAPNARLFDIRILGSGDAEIDESLIVGFRYALMRRFAVVNFSLACSPRMRDPLTELCERAYVQGQILVAARHNMPLLDHGLPARLSSCIGVGSESFDTPFEFKFEKGSPVEYIARGEEIAVAAPGGRYTVQSGTSFAAPAISGLVALLLGAHPDLTPFDVKSILRARAKS